MRQYLEDDACLLGRRHLGPQWIDGRIGACARLDDCMTNIEIHRLPIAKWIPSVAAGSPAGDSVTPLL